MSAGFEDLELTGLSEAELAELSEFIDPDNELLPASDRIPAHTKKKPTGPYDRKNLLKHLEEQAAKSTIGDDYVPFVKKQPPKEIKMNTVNIPAKPAREVTEFDDILNMLDEEDMEELAAELGIHGMVDQSRSRGDEKPIAPRSTGLHRPRATCRYNPPAAKFQGENPQDTDIEEVIQQLRDNDSSLTEVNLNNHGGLDAELMTDLFEALKHNTHLEVLLLSNVRLDEGQAAELGEVLKVNCTLRVLNLESNRITRKGIKAIMRALADNPNTVLRELRMVNQYFAGGAGAEGEIARYLEKVQTITKLGYNFTVPSFRTKVGGLIMRNLDYDRQKRALEAAEAEAEAETEADAEVETP